jgi:hypothetical protein
MSGFLGYRVDADGRLINAPCCCYGDDHRGHPYCEEPTERLLQAEEAGLITRRLDTGWVWVLTGQQRTETK